MPDTNGFLLEMNNISKHFPGVQALDDVSFHLRKGEVLALVGENGAGKSTLIKILSGSYKSDRGTIELNGRSVSIKGPKHAIELGISTIYQETSLVQEITVAENMFLGRQPTGRFGKVDWKTMNHRSDELLEELSINISPKLLISRLSIAQQQMVEIARAFSIDAKIIIMDEPTAAITQEDTEKLFIIIKGIVEKGVSVIYISHRLKEIFQIADRVTVLRDGKTVGTMNVQETDEKSIIRYMVGREIGNIFGDESYRSESGVVLEVRNLSRAGEFHDISFELRRGEILGFSGLVGAGRSEVVRSLFGLSQPDSGELYIDGQKVEIRNSSDAIRRGITFVSEDRRLESVIQGFTVRENSTILQLEKLLNRFRLISARREKELARKYVDAFSVKTPSLEQLAINLSGGNQQKLSLARCLSTSPKILILDEPTKGIDVGAKKEIHTLIKSLARDGMAIIMVSSELPEIIGMCHRVLVMHEGRATGMFKKDEMTEESLLIAAVGNV
jgi:ABC-type sugar transport system ATPase subunit